MGVEVPAVRYLLTERGDIAYQSFGKGERSIIWTPPAWISIETRWEHAAELRLWEFLCSLGQVVLFDPRGFGVSEHLPLDRVGQLDEFCFDLSAVVDGLTRPPTVLIATATAALAAIQFVTTRPDAVERMVLLNAVAAAPRRGTAPAAQLAAETRKHWGAGERATRGLASMDDLRRRTAGRAERLGATPAVAEAAQLALLSQDVGPLLGQVAVPTLVVHTGDIPGFTAHMSEAVAGGIPGAIHISRPSVAFNWGDWDADLKHFITGADEDLGGRRDLAAVVFTDIVGSTEYAAAVGDSRWRETLGYLDTFVEREVTRRGGRVLKQTGDGHLLEFARPGDALDTAGRLVVGAAPFGFQLRVGVHYAEVERRPNGDIGGIGVHVAARIAALAGPGEVLVSRTVTELTAGSGHSYADRGAHSLKGMPGEWQLYAVAPI